MEISFLLFTCLNPQFQIIRRVRLPDARLNAVDLMDPIPSLLQFPPGGQNDSLILQCLFKYRIDHGLQSSFAHRSAAGNIFEFGRRIRAVHDEHRNAGLKGFQRINIFCGFISLQLPVVVCDICWYLPFIGCIVQIIQYG